MSEFRSPGWRLHSALVEKVQELEALAVPEKIVFRVTSGFRGFKKQAILYNAFRRSPAEARTRYGVVSRPAPMGLSRHHPYFDGKCAAVDLAVIAVSREDKAIKQQRLGELAESIGLVWGGRWPTPDTVHFELITISGHRVDTAEEYERLGAQLDRVAGILNGEP